MRLGAKLRSPTADGQTEDLSCFTECSAGSGQVPSKSRAANGRDKANIDLRFAFASSCFSLPAQSGAKRSVSTGQVVQLIEIPP